ncbi:hypothetical protein BJ085DRAFT_31267 [Dimargaris cristalligena]|uniref:F-box domain-containing protein n=1 Tax=Dimargaris cristalligena TaxID=215637 RepID=A0A4P9ZMR3_9FUNG|nr:hypothetical protein BJ085DRAFT_31267 [Dimargaris cristalligena]|eukprot:RKP34696.1 hypothetical protein BJ085DRAFT_31267 [Dimargaris cristalligena]
MKTTCISITLFGLAMAQLATAQPHPANPLNDNSSPESNLSAENMEPATNDSISQTSQTGNLQRLPSELLNVVNNLSGPSGRTQLRLTSKVRKMSADESTEFKSAQMVGFLLPDLGNKTGGFKYSRPQTKNEDFYSTQSGSGRGLPLLDEVHCCPMVSSGH